MRQTKTAGKDYNKEGYKKITVTKIKDYKDYNTMKRLPFY